MSRWRRPTEGATSGSAGWGGRFLAASERDRNDRGPPAPPFHGLLLVLSRDSTKD